MSAILKGKKKKKVRNFLWDRFHLMHEHQGFENRESIEAITNITLKYCERVEIINRAEKINKYFRDKFLSEVSQVLYSLRVEYNTYFNKNREKIVKKNKYFLRGFECECIGGRGFYYYPKNKGELNRIETKDQGRVDAKIINHDIRKSSREIYSKDFLLNGHKPPSLIERNDKQNGLEIA